VKRVKERILVFEAAIETRDRGACPAGDLADVNIVEILLPKHFFSGVEQALQTLLRPRLARGSNPQKL